MDHAVTEDTVIIPVMNGVDPGDRIRSLISRGTVVDSLIYIVSFANEDYSVTQQGDFAESADRDHGRRRIRKGEDRGKSRRF